MSESVLKVVLHRLVASALAGVAVIGLSSSVPAAIKAAPHISGVAVVVDGDTIDIAGQRIRLEGIDAPEMAQTCGRGWFGTWACGKASAKALTALIGSREITCSRQGTDKYGRMLGVCSVAGEDLNATMVRSGMAWAFVKYSKAYVDIEMQAKAQKAGIWQGEAEAPWVYREQHWQAAKQTAPDGCAIKGNVSAKGQIYHMPWSPWYNKVSVNAARGERWFCSEAEAQKAGWRASQTH